MIRVDARRFLRDMKDEPASLRKATAYALTDTAKDVHTESKKRMSDVFDRPTRWTLNSLFVLFARASDVDPAAEVRQKPSSAGRHYLSIEEDGGARPQTGAERLLSRLLRKSSIHGLTPAPKAKLDRSGNWSRAQRSSALEALKSGVGAAGQSKTNTQYFAVVNGGRLSSGIYSRLRGGGIRKIANIVDRAPRYKPVLGIYDMAGRIFEQRFYGHFARIADRIRSGSSKQ